MKRNKVVDEIINQLDLVYKNTSELNIIGILLLISCGLILLYGLILLNYIKLDWFGVMRNEISK